MVSFQKDKLHVQVYPTRREMGLAAAQDVAQTIDVLLKQQPEVNIIFASAPSQTDFLEELSAIDRIDWQRINAFHMDEYLGLPEQAPQGFGYYLKNQIFDKFPFRTINYMNGNCTSPEDECKRYADLLQRYPTDIVCMGIGENAHIAFNDPHVAHFDDPEWVKKVDLDNTSRMQQVNDGCFNSIDEVPLYAITLTVPTLMKGRYLFCIVPTRSKALAIYHTMNNLISEAVPATCLRMHENAKLYTDMESVKMLSF